MNTQFYTKGNKENQDACCQAQTGVWGIEDSAELAAHDRESSRRYHATEMFWHHGEKEGTSSCPGIWNRGPAINLTANRAAARSVQINPRSGDASYIEFTNWDILAHQRAPHAFTSHLAPMLKFRGEIGTLCFEDRYTMRRAPGISRIFPSTSDCWAAEISASRQGASAVRYRFAPALEKSGAHPQQTPCTLTESRRLCKRIGARCLEVQRRKLRRCRMQWYRHEDGAVVSGRRRGSRGGGYCVRDARWAAWCKSLSALLENLTPRSASACDAPELTTQKIREHLTVSSFTALVAEETNETWELQKDQARRARGRVHAPCAPCRIKTHACKPLGGLCSPHTKAARKPEQWRRARVRLYDTTIYTFTPTPVEERREELSLFR